MDEARDVLDRLERIDDLRRRGSPAAELREEVRALLREAEAWTAAEPAGTARAEEAIERCRELIAAHEGAVTIM